ADEPTTALDVTIQAQVLELMRELRKQLNTSMLLITHDLGVVAQNCEYVAVIYAGEIVEYGTVMEIFKDMRHPYTIGLFTSLPNLNKVVRRLIPIEGLMPDPMYLPSGCKFSERCMHVMDICREKHPEMSRVDGEHTVRCFLHQGLTHSEADNGR
ncbi:MAG: ABC transporter ATP-binding protein, partial [Rectinemataceae bacterium]|nr:ABC transporter ATP-binding protein [Rectinemataceae bacterium]